MEQEFNRYRLDPSYCRPESQYGPEQPSNLEGYQHPPKFHYKRPEWEERDWETVYSHLPLEEQERLQKYDWHSDYSRLSENIRIEIESLVCQAVSEFPNHDFVTAISNSFNVHRFDVISAAGRLSEDRTIGRTEESGYKEYQLLLGTLVTLTASVA